MYFTDIFIRRPVLATVISLLIVLVGVRSYLGLTVREYPQAENASITIQTVYTGANADLVKGFITTPLETEIATAQGIDYIESTSVQGVSIITANLELNYNPYDALTQITSKVNQVRSDLPQEAQAPTLDLQVGESTSLMYMSFFSDVLENNQITDYLVRVVQPKLNTVAGVQQARIIGARTFAMRVWLQPDKMASLGVTAAQVRQVLEENNFQAAVGSTRGQMITVDLTADTDLNSTEAFRDLVIKRTEGATIRMSDVADIELGAESYDTSVNFNGTPATFIGIDPAPGANVLDVAAGVREAYADIKSQLPTGLESAIPYDATEAVQESINEVVMTLIEAIVIVIVVIFAFLGSLRSVAIPVIAVPLSIVGTAFIMLTLGYSINLLTLLAMVLAIGLVVDDAIIVVENIHRHIEEGMTPYEAAIKGTRELGGPIIAMTITLLAVFAPIGFVGGLTGTLFSEFAFSLAGAVIISGIVALTLSPMMCSKILKGHGNGEQRGRLEAFLDRVFDKFQGAYERRLHGALNTLPVILVFGAVVLVSCVFLFTSAKSQLAPDEDQGFVLVKSDGAPTASLDQTELFTSEITDMAMDMDAVARVFQFNGVAFGGPPKSNTAITGMAFVPWSEREKTSGELKNELQAKASQVPGMDSVAFEPPVLPGSSGGLPVQFVIGTTDEARQLYDVSQEMLRKAQESGLFVFASSNMNYDKPRVSIQIDREKAADLGITMAEIGRELGSMMSGGFVNRFSIQGRSYKVTPQVTRMERLNPEQLQDYHIRASNGELVPMSTLVTLERTVQPQELRRFQQLNSAKIEGVPRPGVSLGEAIGFLQQAAEETLPRGYTVDYAGSSRQYVQEGSALVVTFFIAIAVIFLVLAAQFESFRDPLIILVTVPMAVAGALIFVTLGGTPMIPWDASINIYTQVGLVTLIGVISKHGILIVQFANQLQREGYDKRTAIEHASAIRLRPVLMTTAALVLAVVPLILATGAGAGARFNMGLVIASGMTIGTLFTLFVLPGVYLVLAREHQAEEPVEV
ncbi:efflux RND transporter permease subunit [Halofilum ochraceum]|uniref:efflux RND transporter permease subunit n=1 Tax=Halofilum ochraceum TaxID=1611323 RepID=UPI00082C7A9B|nr:efflux RND transporter permease subunit [Halofilum ochraceum]